jgi:hypothetical protein
MKSLMIVAIFLSSAFAVAKPPTAGRAVASKGELGMKIRIDDAQAKDLFFLLEKKGATRSGNASPIIQYKLNNVVCTGVNSHGNAPEGFSCEIDI